MKSLKAAAEKRKKPKAAKVPYDKERRAAAMRAGWLKRKGLSAQRTIPRLEQGGDAQQAGRLHAEERNYDLRDEPRFTVGLCAHAKERPLSPSFRYTEMMVEAGILPPPPAR